MSAPAMLRPEVDPGRWRHVSVRFWNDERVARLSRPKPNAQSLLLYLLTAPTRSKIPGLIRATEAGIARELGWTLRGFRRSFAEIEREGIAKADWTAGLVWLPKAFRHDPPQNPNVVTSWREVLSDELPECDLLREALAGIRAQMVRCLRNPSSYLKSFDEIAGIIASQPTGNPSGEASGNPSGEASGNPPCEASGNPPGNTDHRPPTTDDRLPTTDHPLPPQEGEPEKPAAAVAELLWHRFTDARRDRRLSGEHTPPKRWRAWVLEAVAAIGPVDTVERLVAAWERYLDDEHFAKRRWPAAMFIASREIWLSRVPDPIDPADVVEVQPDPAAVGPCCAPGCCAEATDRVFTGGPRGMLPACPAHAHAWREVVRTRPPPAKASALGLEVLDFERWIASQPQTAGQEGAAA